MLAGRGWTEDANWREPDRISQGANNATTTYKMEVVAGLDP